MKSINDIKIEKEEMLLMAHTLGVNLLYSIKYSDKKKDRVLPVTFVRNFYGKRESDYLLDSMVESELLTKKFQLGTFSFFCTPKAIIEFREAFKILCPYVPAKDRNLEYLKSKINAYCYLYNYAYSKDKSKNADTIIKYYTEYFIQGEKLSHTVSDVISSFHEELKVFYPNNKKATPF